MLGACLIDSESCSPYPNDEHGVGAVLSELFEQIGDAIVIGLLVSTTGGIVRKADIYKQKRINQEVTTVRPSASAIGVAVAMVAPHLPESGSNGQVTTKPTSKGPKSLTFEI